LIGKGVDFDGILSGIEKRMGERREETRRKEKKRESEKRERATVIMQ
jgi:hypothetical protein